MTVHGEASAKAFPCGAVGGPEDAAHAACSGQRAEHEPVIHEIARLHAASIGEPGSSVQRPC
jgi:hypothetical protein